MIHPPAPWVGNDVIDTSAEACAGKTSDRRFLERVLGPEERARILASEDPDRALWRVWGAKESAFKVVSKLRGAPPPFTHARFAVREGLDGPAHVEFEDLVIPFGDAPGPSAGPDAIHVVAWASALDASLPGHLVARARPLPADEPPVRSLTERERKAVHSPASAWVRLLARAEAAGLLDVPEDALEIVCGEGPPGRTAPKLLLRGEASRWDVSLSHHGRFVAWALRGPA